MPTHGRVDDLDRLAAACLACLRAVAEAYEDAGVRGLCGAGRREAALAAVRAVEPGPPAAPAPEPRQATRPKGAEMALERGRPIPEITVRRLDGSTFTSREIWQRRNLLLAALAGEGAGHDRAAAAYAAALAAHDAELQAYETALVVTADPVAGLPSPAVLIADRWGEIVTVERAPDIASLPAAGELLEWLRFVAHACPECEGEAR